MTPEKLLDYSVKFGVLPFMLYMVFITRQDLADTKQEVKEMRGLLIDCYQDKITAPIHGITKEVHEQLRMVAVLPNKCKSIKECLS